MKEMAEVTDRLVRNEFIATLSAEYKLQGPIPQDDLWEAALAALPVSNGRQGLADFFVPIVKREFLRGSNAVAGKEDAKMDKVGKAANSTVPPPPEPPSTSSPSSTKSVILPQKTKILSPPATAGVDLWQNSKEKKRRSSLAKLKPLHFPSLEVATRELLTRLQEEKVTFSFRRVKRTLHLRLPGYPLICVMGKKGAAMGGMETLVGALVRQGAVKLDSTSSSGKGTVRAAS
ncbi:hypothetical protein JCM6882_008489 [Rhodosporidiobolus microsporus]